MLVRYNRQESATCCGKTQSALERDRFQRNMTYLLRAVVSSFPFWLNKRQEKKENVPRRRIEQQFKRNRPPALNIRARPRARLGQLSRNEATGQVDARDGICALRGTPAECILRVADVKWLKGLETRPTCASRRLFYAGVIRISPRTLYEENWPSQCICDHYRVTSSVIATSFYYRYDRWRSSFRSW